MAKRKETKKAKKPVLAGTVAGKKEPSYTAKDIYVLEGLEPVRKRPGMYIGTTDVAGLHHLIWEVVDNSIDEAMAGYAKNIRVELLPNNRVAVTDDGRGIPVETHPQTKKSTLETVMTTLHAGGKFGGESYKVSGGLHGVGVSVVCALSSWMKVEVCRGGGLYVQEYKRGNPQYKVKKIGKCAVAGTKVSFEPDPEIFSAQGGKVADFDLKRIFDHLRQQAFLTKGVRIEVIDSRDSQNPRYNAFYFDGGLLSFIKYLSRSEKPIQETPFYVRKSAENVEVEAAFLYTEDTDIEELSFANNIYTPDGGMHLTGFRSALTRVINNYAYENEYLKKNEESLTGDDVHEGLIAIISVKLREPQFEGQTKARLGSPQARTAVESVTGEALKDFFERHNTDARRIIERCLLAAKARKAAKAAKETVLRKGVLEGLTLPGKLADCSSRDPAESELFIVEGDSAGGCFSGDTKVALVDGRSLSFEDLIKEDKRGIKNYCYTIGRNGSIEIGEIVAPRVTKRNADVIKIILDNNEEITCTPDHKFMMVDRTYKEARHLSSGDSLMPIYRQLSKLGKRITIKGYEMLFDPRQKRWIFTHLLSDRYNLQKGIYSEADGLHRHHKDFNKLNNSPDNVVRLTAEQHLELHRRTLENTMRRPEILARLRKIHKTPKFRNKISKAMLAIRSQLSARAKKQWENLEYKQYMIKKFLDFYNNNPSYQKQNNKQLNKAQALYWSNEKNRQKQAERVRGYFADSHELREKYSNFAKEQWNDKELLKWRSAKTKEQWTQEFREKRKIAYSETYRQKALKVLRTIYEEAGKIDVVEYNRIRKETNDKNLLRYDTLLKRFFDSSEVRLHEQVAHYNHKVKSIIKLDKKVDVYDVEIPGTHNFALAAGVFVHNSSKQGRDRRTQAILPLKGKILNVEKSRIDKMLINKEIRSLVVALGTAIADTFDLANLRYHKIIIMTDADVDGSHIRTLLLTLFYRYFRPIIDNGHLYIAQPPLYRIQRGKEIRYAYREDEKEKVVKSLGGEQGVSFQRYKGLGEMNPEQLWETAMNPANRLLKRVVIEDAQEADRLFDILLGEQVEPRREFIQSRAQFVKNLDV